MLRFTAALAALLVVSRVLCEPVNGGDKCACDYPIGRGSCCGTGENGHCSCRPGCTCSCQSCSC